MFKKGESGNKSGRPKGKQNRVTVDLRQRINEIVQNNVETIESDLQALDSKDRLLILEKLISYCVPKMKSVDQQIEISDRPMFVFTDISGKIVEPDL